MIEFLHIITVTRRILRRLGHRQQVERGVIALVQEDHAVDLLRHNIPAVHRARSSHQLSQDSIRGKDVALAFDRVLLQNGIFLAGDVVEQLVLAATQARCSTNSKTLIGVIELVDMTTGVQIVCGGRVGLELSKIGQVQFVHQLPVSLHSQRRIAVLTTITLAETSLATTSTEFVLLSTWKRAVVAVLGLGGLTLGCNSILTVTRK